MAARRVQTTTQKPRKDVMEKYDDVQLIKKKKTEVDEMC